MYIVRRAAQVAGLAGLEWATAVTKVVQDAGVPASLWMGGPGAMPGGVVWSVPVDSYVGWFEITEQLLANPDYQAVVAGGRDVVMAFEADRMLQVVHGEVDGAAEVGQFVGAIEGQSHPERQLEAMAFAAEITDAWSATTGRSAVVATNAAGEMGTVTWLARYEDAASIDAANAAIAASSDYQAVLAKGAGLFTTGVQAYARRIA